MDLCLFRDRLLLDPVTNTLVTGDVGFQTDRVLKNLSGILRAAGTSLEKVVRSTVFLKNMGDFAAMNEVYGSYFHSRAAGTLDGGSCAAAQRRAGGDRCDRAGLKTNANHRGHEGSQMGCRRNL